VRFWIWLGGTAAGSALLDMVADAVAALADELADTSRPVLYGGIIVAGPKVIGVAELLWNGAVQARASALDDAWDVFTAALPDSGKG
jgi:hypothetical protein